MSAIEPISNAMSFQAQPVQGAQVARSSQSSAERPTSDFTNVSSEMAAASVDSKTIVVDSAGKSDAEGDSYENPQNGMPNAQKRAQQKAEASAEQIKKAVEDLNRKMGNSEVLYGIHEGTKRVTIKIVDKETKETIKEFPPEKTLDMIAKVWEMAGIMVDEKR